MVIFLLAVWCKKSLKGRTIICVLLHLKFGPLHLLRQFYLLQFMLPMRMPLRDRMAQLEARLIAMEARLAAAEAGPQAASNVSEARMVELETRLAEAEQETKAGEGIGCHWW